MPPVEFATALLPELLSPGLIEGRAAVVVDALRATTTIVQAISAGASCVVPCLTPEDAVAVRAARPHDRVLLGGERHARRLTGFDLGNAPAEYAPAVVAGAVVAMTTTNGTRAILAARGAHAVLIGCLGNVSAVALFIASLARAGRSIVVVCAGTNGRVSGEDCLFAGRLALACRDAGVALDPCDSTRLVEAFAQRVMREPAGILGAFRGSHGGRNLISAGMDADIEWCAREDWSSVVPAFDHARGTITARHECPPGR